MLGVTPNVQLVRDQQPTRQQRRPTSPFMLRHKPFEIQPMYIMPVLPGETLQHLNLQAYAVSDPLRNKLTGWWLEYYFFYVKIRDLDDRDTLERMFIDPTFGDSDLSAIDDPTQNYPFYNPAGTGVMNWTKLCLKRVVEEYFRGENELWNSFVFASGMPIAQVVSPPGWMDSLLASDDYVAEDVTISTAGDDAFGMSELEGAWQTWQLARANNLTQMEFEDYLQMSGVGGVAVAEPHKPELIRYVRHWVPPTNTVEPTTGTPSTAMVKLVQERADKKRYFTEPGFILGCTVARPKVYYNLTGSACHYMTTMKEWLPPQLRNDPRMGNIGFSAGAGPAADGLDTEAYRISCDDILLFGDQFINFDPDPATEDFASTVSLPVDGTNLVNTRYVTETDANRLFADEGGDPGTALFVRQDGIVSVSISSTLRNSIVGAPPAI